MADTTNCFLEIDNTGEIPRVDLRPDLPSHLPSAKKWVEQCGPGEAYVFNGHGGRHLIVCLRTTWDE
jgi:hypothetical protein